MIFDVSPAIMNTSAVMEAGLSSTLSSTTAAVAAPLTTAMPMGTDLDSVQFATALNGAGAAFIGVASAHAVERQLFAATQEIAAATYVASDVVNDAALAL